MARIEDFLRAMGGMFAFMGSQFRLEVDGREFFIDLLLFHRHLRSLVAIELKIGEFEPEFVGKMQFYLAALDAQVRQKDENPSIGIILCKEKGARLWNTPCAMRASRLAWPPTKSPRPCPKIYATNCPHPKPLRACWTTCDLLIKPGPAGAAPHVAG